jgi:hypothetical protein
VSAFVINSYALGGEDPDAAAYLNAVETADTQALEAAVRKAVDDFVKGCKADGIWSAITASCILAGARTLAGALTPLVGPAPTNVSSNFVSGDYNRETGLIGDGSTKYLNSNKAGDSEALNSYHMAAWQTVADTRGTGVTTSLLGDTSGAAVEATILAYTATAGNALIGRNRNTTVSTHPSATRTTIGFFGNSRSVSSEYILRGNGTNSTFAIASNSRAVANVSVFARGGTFLTNARLSFYSIGSAIDLALLNTRVSTLMTDLDAAI